MKYTIRAAVAALAIFAGMPLVSLADDTDIAERPEISASEALELQRDLAERAEKDAEAMASDALIAAANLDLTAEIELENRAASHTSVLMAGEL